MASEEAIAVTAPALPPPPSLLLDRRLRVAPTIPKPEPTMITKRKRRLDWDVTELSYEQYVDQHYAREGARRAAGVFPVVQGGGGRW